VLDQQHLTGGADDQPPHAERQAAGEAPVEVQDAPQTRLNRMAQTVDRHPGPPVDPSVEDLKLLEASRR